MECVLGCDLGTQSLRGLLLSVTGGIVAEAQQEYAVDYPQPGWAEQDPRQWQSAFISVTRKLLTQAGRGVEVKGIALGSQVDGLVAVNAQGYPLRPALLWLDRRATEQCARIAARLDQGWIFALTGLNLDPSHVAPKILWLRDQEPAVYRQTRWFLLPGAFMVQWLTSHAIIDYSNASSSMLLDVRTRQWSEALLQSLDIAQEQLGKVDAAMAIAGTLQKKIAEESGLKAGTPVMAGCGDEHAACVAAGVLRPGLVCDITGTAEPVGCVAEQPVFDTTGLVETHCHADPQSWLIENPGFVSGGSYRWLRDILGQADYTVLNAEAADVAPGSDGVIFLPCLSGAMVPAWNADARGVFFGLAMAHSRGHLVRAVMEGCAYGLRDVVERMEDMGLAVNEIRVVGGGARSSLWCQIRADITRKPLVVPRVVEGTALGAAMIAAVGIGWFPSLLTAAHTLFHEETRYFPSPATEQVYTKRYQQYRQLYSRIEPLFSGEE